MRPPAEAVPTDPDPDPPPPPVSILARQTRMVELLLAICVLGSRHGYRRRRAMMPWALLGAVIWLLPTLWVVVRVTR